MRYSVRVVLSVLLLAASLSAKAGQTIDGIIGPPTQRDGMHSCKPRTGIVTGLFLSANWLICLDYGDPPWSTNASVGSNQLPIPPGTRGAGQTMVACTGDKQFVGGVHLQNNLLRCITVDRATSSLLAAKNLTDKRSNLTFVEMPQGVDVLTCPKGMAMVGLHADLGVVACAYPPVCDIQENCARSGGTCQNLGPGVNVRACL